MSKRWRYFFRALALMNLVGIKLPMYVADKVITVDEMADFMTEILNICGWKAHISVSDKLTGGEFDFELLDN